MGAPPNHPCHFRICHYPCHSDPSVMETPKLWYPQISIFTIKTYVMLPKFPFIGFLLPSLLGIAFPFSSFPIPCSPSARARAWHWSLANCKATTCSCGRCGFSRGFCDGNSMGSTWGISQGNHGLIEGKIMENLRTHGVWILKNMDKYGGCPTCFSLNPSSDSCWPNIM